MRFRAVFHSAFLAVFLTVLCGAALGAAPEPWDAPVFTASPAELAKAASAVDSGKGFDATVLLDQREIQVDENGSTRERFHLVYRVNSDAGVQSWSSTGLLWEPWHQKRPVVRARVITADGVEHVLDPKTLSDTPARENASDIYSDTRSYRGPLPAVAIGAVVEEEITIEDTAPTISGARWNVCGLVAACR